MTEDAPIGEVLTFPAGQVACGWFWEDKANSDLEHVCVRKPGHKGRHVCWCGGDDLNPCESCGSLHHATRRHGRLTRGRAA